LKILLVEDESRMAEALSELLRLEDYEVTVCEDGISGLGAILDVEYDIIILDVMLPGMSGFEITKRARRRGIKTPILMLTAKTELDDKVMGLDSGADDYLAKPFETRELLARLRALVRRNDVPVAEVLNFGDMELNVTTCNLTCTTNGQSVRLSEKEFRILEYFILNQKMVLTREQLALRIWGYDYESEYNNVEVYLTFTRKKILFIGAAVEIKALRGIGYELRSINV